MTDYSLNDRLNRLLDQPQSFLVTGAVSEAEFLIALLNKYSSGHVNCPGNIPNIYNKLNRNINKRLRSKQDIFEFLSSSDTGLSLNEYNISEAESYLSNSTNPLFPRNKKYNVYPGTNTSIYNILYDQTDYPMALEILNKNTIPLIDIERTINHIAIANPHITKSLMFPIDHIKDHMKENRIASICQFQLRILIFNLTGTQGKPNNVDQLFSLSKKDIFEQYRHTILSGCYYESFPLVKQCYIVWSKIFSDPTYLAKKFNISDSNFYQEIVQWDQSNRAVFAANGISV